MMMCDAIVKQDDIPMVFGKHEVHIRVFFVLYLFQVFLTESSLRGEGKYKRYLQDIKFTFVVSV